MAEVQRELLGDEIVVIMVPLVVRLSAYFSGVNTCSPLPAESPLAEL